MTRLMSPSPALLRKVLPFPLAVMAAAVGGCLQTVQRQVHGADAAADGQRPVLPSVVYANAPDFLKAHTRSGHVVRFTSWTIDTAARTVSGPGQRFDLNRQAGDSGGTHTVSLDSVVLFESNRVLKHTSAALTVVSGVSLGATAACAANPKACFGSCPTLYVGDGTARSLEAESFSSSVSPSLEATDVDALPGLVAVNGVATVHVRNEALETHNIRSMTLLAVEHAPGSRVYATESGAFWLASRTLAPQQCAASEGSCLDAVRAAGGGERSTRVDPRDLAARETLELTFPATHAPQIGLVLRARQSLVSTFLFYQTLAWMGSSAGGWFAALERGDSVAHRQARLASDALGGIEVQQPQQDGTWRTVATTAEHGPLAADVRLLPLSARSANDSGPVRVRLRLSKGAWRIDQVALAELVRPATVAALQPATVLREQRRGTTADPEALARLRDSTRFLTTTPGDGYAVQYRVPATSQQLSYFVAVRGYYLEWMRQEWLAEENPVAAAALLADPARAMKALAPRFAALEPTMERSFWGSRHALR